MNDVDGFLLITGASSGLGREIALRLSTNHRLILGGRDEERLQAVRAHCQTANDHLVWRYDLVDIDGLGESLTHFLHQHGAQVEGLVHSAARLDVLPLRGLTPAMVGETFRTNVFSALELVRTLTKKKVNHHRLSAVVFISSIASQFGAKGFSAYSASKGALDALMRSLAVELAPQVRVNSVLPGALRTSMTASMFDDPQLAERLAADYPLGIGAPSNIVDAVEFLLSERARWITGQQLVVDGGRTANITA
jgi:NAD(P)-dependent dehydrogenase (short-subunit alcohol dehydrogenase family)